MTDPATVYLGPITEARFAEAFKDGAKVTAGVAAWVLGDDEKTLAKMTDDGIVQAVAKGARRAYTERALRTYLVEGAPPEKREKEKPWASGSTQRAGSITTNSSSKVVAFTALPASKPCAKRKPSSGRSARTPRSA